MAAKKKKKRGKATLKSKATPKRRAPKKRKPTAKKRAPKKRADPFGSIEELDRMVAAYRVLEFGKAVTSNSFAKLVVNYVQLSALGEKPPPLDEGISPLDREVDQYAQQLAEMVIRTATSVRDEPVSFEGKTLRDVLGEKPKFQQTAEQLREREEKLEGKMLTAEIDEDDYQAWLQTKPDTISNSAPRPWRSEPL